MSRRVQHRAGFAAAVVYRGHHRGGAAITPGYSHTRDFTSSLTQSGAARMAILDPPFLIY